MTMGLLGMGTCVYPTLPPLPHALQPPLHPAPQTRSYVEGQGRQCVPATTSMVCSTAIARMLLLCKEMANCFGNCIRASKETDRLVDSSFDHLARALWVYVFEEDIATILRNCQSLGKRVAEGSTLMCRCQVSQYHVRGTRSVCCRKGVRM